MTSHKENIMQIRETFHFMVGLDSFVEIEVDYRYSIKTEHWNPGNSSIFYAIDWLDVVRINSFGKEVSRDEVLDMVRSKINEELDEMDPMREWTVEPSWA